MMASNLNGIISFVKREATQLNIKNVFVALSGGADSVALVHALKSIGLNVVALHCNFRLRGAESDRDMGFVSTFCETYGIALEIKEFDTKTYIKENKGISVEMACRDLRYKWFEEKLLNSDFNRLATGHNADDNIETFLINMLRGSGTRGLKGMRKDNGLIWRPLLKFHRSEILRYIEENHLSFILDSSNLKSDFRRNYLRNKVIPLLKEEWKGFDKAMDKTIQNLDYENTLIENVMGRLLPETGQPLEVATILSSPAPLLLIKRYLDAYGPFSSTPKEVMAAINANKPHIKTWRLKRGILFLRNGKLFIEMSHGECCS